MADQEMKFPEMMRINNLQVTLDPHGIELDRAGRIRFINPQILQALINASTLGTADGGTDGGTNNSQCGCNLSQCGK